MATTTETETAGTAAVHYLQKLAQGPDDVVVQCLTGESNCRGIRPGTSPYLARPERASWTERVTFKRPDGSTYTYTKRCSRWAGTFSQEEWGLQTDGG